MKPVRVMGDVLRPKVPVKKRWIKSTAQAVLKFSNIRVPFFLSFTLLFIEGFFIFEVVGIVVPRSSSDQVLGMGHQVATIAVIDPLQTLSPAVVASLNSVSTNAIASSTITTSSIIAKMKSGLLPLAKFFGFKQTTGIVFQATTTTQVVKEAQSSTISQSKSTTILSAVITAKSFLDATTLSTSERVDGTYAVELTTDMGTSGKLIWDFSNTTIVVPKSQMGFSVSSSCDPVPNTPAPESIDQSLVFEVKTAYTCTVNLTPTFGTDRETRSKQFSFTTGPGQLVVTPPPSMNNLLANDMNFGGFVFRNDDSQPLMITGMDVDISYTGLDVSNGPLVLRFSDSASDAILFDYHMENIPAVGSSSYAHVGTKIHIPLYFTINPGSQKMLPVTVLGVHRLSVYGVDPKISVALRAVTTDHPLNRIVLTFAQLTWSCVVPVGVYDPNAMSGAYATGQACR